MTASASYQGYATPDVVSGEAVSLELPIASLVQRAAAGLIDVLLAITLIVGGVVTILALLSDASGAVLQASLILLIAGVVVGIPTAVETATRGRTLGKLILGLRVVRDDGGAITARHALVRALVGWLEVYLLQGAPALISALVTSRVKRLGDLAAGTYVITERRRLQLIAPIAMPANYAVQAWAATADIVSLPTPLALAVRAFLGRAPSMSASQRAAMASDLITQCAPFLSPTPPPAHPEAVLAAVIAERRRRDAMKLARDQEFRERLRAQVTAPLD